MQYLNLKTDCGPILSQYLSSASLFFYEKRMDFKYRYRKENRLEPVLNLTLYWGKKRWESLLSRCKMLIVTWDFSFLTIQFNHRGTEIVSSVCVYD